MWMIVYLLYRYVNLKFLKTVNKEITEVYFNIDKALAEFAENILYQGVSSQQYTLTSANNLADFLSDALDNLQNAMGMPSPGQGRRWNANARYYY